MMSGSGSFRFRWFAIAVAIVLSLQLASCCRDVDDDLAPPTSTITVNWSSLIYTSTTHLTLQIVVNPLVTQESPIHSHVWESLRQLKSEYTRFAPWYPYPRLTIAELQPPSGVSTCSDVLEGNDIHLSCPDGVIDSIEFASFGTPHGTCTQYKVGSCDSPTSLSVISESCLNRTSCSIAATNAVFGGDPCHNTPKRLAVQVTCNPTTNHTYWNFTLLDPIYHDFFTATEGRPTVMSVSPQPEWWYQFPNGDVPRVPDADMGLDWNYREGKILLDPTATTIGDYFGRVVAWYTSGGFTDEYGVFHQSNHHYNFTLWEVLNEPDYEHWNGIEQYTTIYDSVVHGIRRHAPEAAKNMKFVGLALGGPGDDLSRFTYFLNASNHAADVPLDWISYHFYVTPSSRTSPSTWSSEFRTQSDHFIDTVTKIQAIRAQLSPNTRTTIDELGCILPNDNDPNSADIPPIYWNACAGELAIMYTRLAELGIDVVGASQLVGYKKLNVMGGLPPQYPSVALLDWDTGVGNSHYWMLYLLLQFFGADVISKQAMFTTVAGQGHVFAQGWTITRQDTTIQQIVLVVNQDYAPVNVMVQGMNGGMAYMLDVTCGLAPAYEMNLTSDTILFAEYAAAIIVAPNDATSTFSVSSF